MQKKSSRYDIEDLSHHYSNALEAVEYAIDKLEALLAKPRFAIPKPGGRVYLELHRDMPYIIHDTSLPGTQILVNRNYKPIGSNSRAHINYEQHLTGHVRLSPAQIASVVSPGRECGLFGDENPPWSSKKAATEYLSRLIHLRKLLATNV